MRSTEEIGGVKQEGKLPECSDGEVERNLRIADRPKVPKLSKPEKTRFLNCERPCAMAEWRAMPKWLQRGTLENTKMDYYGTEATSEETGDSEGKAPASSEPPPPVAPITYWRDKQEGGEVEKGTEKLPNEVIQKEVIQKEVIQKAMTPKEKIPKRTIPGGCFRRKGFGRKGSQRT